VQQRRAHVDRCANRPERDRFLEQLLVVIRRRDVAAEQDVRVVVDQAGQHRGMAQVDDFGARWNRERRANFADALALDQDDGVGARSGALAVDQPAAADRHAAGCGRLGRQQARREQ
jgi:hypothetical protein